MTSLFGRIVVGRVPRYVGLGITVSHIGQPSSFHTLEPEVQSRVRDEFHASLRLEQTSLIKRGIGERKKDKIRPKMIKKISNKNDFFIPATKKTGG